MVQRDIIMKICDLLAPITCQVVVRQAFLWHPKLGRKSRLLISQIRTCYLPVARCLQQWRRAYARGLRQRHPLIPNEQTYLVTI